MVFKAQKIGFYIIFWVGMWELWLIENLSAKVPQTRHAPQTLPHAQCNLFSKQKHTIRIAVFNLHACKSQKLREKITQNSCFSKLKKMDCVSYFG